MGLAQSLRGYISVEVWIE